MLFFVEIHVGSSKDGYYVIADSMVEAVTIAEAKAEDQKTGYSSPKVKSMALIADEVLGVKNEKDKT